MTGKSNITLCLFTSSFPFGNGETFLETEIKILSQRFDKIFIFPAIKSNTKRIIPKNSKVIYLENNWKHKRLINFLKFGFSSLALVLYDFIKNRKLNNSFFLHMDLAMTTHYKAEKLKVIVNKNSDNFIFYSYWFESWATTLSILKKKKIINNFFSRAHGFDLFEERSKKGVTDNRAFQLNYVDKVFSVSKNGCDYLKKRYPKYKGKINYSYLGSHDNGIGPDTNKSTFINLISVSYIKPVKRLDLIIDSLMYCKQNIHWTHIGDGPDYDFIINKSTKLPSNIRVNFLGNLSNKEVLNNYQKNYYDVLINVSQSEGLPFSIVEAISFGIPVIATDVGGTSEIVNKKTGILIDKSFSPFQLAKTIDSLPENISIFNREVIRDYWLKNFFFSTNYNKFIDELIS